MSRDAVESVPVIAQVYSGLAFEDSSPAVRGAKEETSFSRGDVESYPADPKPTAGFRNYVSYHGKKILGNISS